MATVQLPPAVLNRLPAGYDASQVRILTANAVITPIENETPAESAIVAELETGGVPLITNGRPTIMRVVAWVAHEGVNKNRLAFLAEDLEDVAKKIAPPDILPMDFNHSAVVWSMEQPVIGAWYAAEVAVDPDAKAPRGPKGLLARGIVWSALFPEYSNRLLAEQARKGYLEFSMACFPEWTEVKEDDAGPYEVAHKPVFFTVSALDIPPADPDAKGVGKEGADADFEAQASTQLKAAAHEILKLMQCASKRAEGTDMKELQDIVEFLKANADKLATQETLLKVEQQIMGLKEVWKLQPGEMAALQEKLTQLESKVAELQTALDTANGQVETANAQIAQLEATITEQKTKLDEVAAKEAEEAQKAKLAERLAQLPEHVRDAHNALEDEKRSKIEARWSAKSDEEWQEVLDTFALVPVLKKSSFLSRSEETVRPTPAGGGSAVDVLQKYK